MAIDISQIEQRLSTVESGLNQVRQKLGLVPTGANWVEQIAGSLADLSDDEFQRFLDCCRAARAGVASEEPQQ
jgi:hypothetical protein